MHGYEHDPFTDVDNDNQLLMQDVKPAATSNHELSLF